MASTRKAAEARVVKLRSFYEHLFVYVVINGMLLVLNLLTSPGSLWFYWVSIFWGVGLVFHAYDTFGKNRLFGDEWQERKIKEYMDQHPEEKKKGGSEHPDQERKSA